MEQFIYENGILHRNLKERFFNSTQLVLPQKLISEVLQMAHDNPLAGHLSVQKTFEKIKRDFFWPNMKS